MKITKLPEEIMHAALKTGQDLIAAQAEHGKISLRNIAEKLPFNWSTASRLMTIAVKLGVSHVKQRAELPASWGTLYYIAKLPEDIMHHDVV